MRLYVSTIFSERGVPYTGHTSMSAVLFSVCIVAASKSCPSSYLAYSTVLGDLSTFGQSLNFLVLYLRDFLRTCGPSCVSQSCYAASALFAPPACSVLTSDSSSAICLSFSALSFTSFVVSLHFCSYFSQICQAPVEHPNLTSSRQASLAGRSAYRSYLLTS